MTDKKKSTITVQTLVNKPVAEVWRKWITPEFIMQWNNASDDWHTPRAENNLRVGGIFNYRMEAKDGSNGFDFWGTYVTIVPHELIEIVLGDKRKLIIEFIVQKNSTKIIERFEAEEMNSIELQQNGWQAILDNFKKIAEKY